MTRIEAIAALMDGKQICNAAWNNDHQGEIRWVSVDDPSVVDVAAIDWDRVLGAEDDDYQIFVHP